MLDLGAWALPPCCTDQACGDASRALDDEYEALRVRRAAQVSGALGWRWRNGVRALVTADIMRESYERDGGPAPPDGWVLW